MKRSFLAMMLVLVGFVFAAGIAVAGDEVNIDDDGIGIKGYDPVAYFDVRKPTKGQSRFSSDYMGVTYLFASAENRQTFINAPEKYAPAYGGWCSYGVRVGKKFKVDPNAWEIADGRLFLQLDLGTKKVWMSDKDKNIEIADRLWPQIKSVPVATLGN